MSDEKINLQATLDRNWTVLGDLNREQQQGDPGISLRQELAGMRHDLQELIGIVRGLVKLQAIANQKLDTAITGKPDFGVMGGE